jgi:hypothetical protein
LGSTIRKHYKYDESSPAVTVGVAAPREQDHREVSVVVSG